MVGTNTVTIPGSDSAVVRIKGTKKAVCLTTNCNSSYCKLDPKIGTSIAIAESCRNIIASGGKPLAVTNCLNFGNPEKPAIMWEFAQSIKGLSEAVKIFQTPVVSGNVSFYNENKKDSIYPTPVISMVGLVEDTRYVTNQWFKNENDDILLIGNIKNDFGGSQVLKYLNFKQKITSPPALNMRKHLEISNFIYKIIRKFDVVSVHDIAEGGLLIAIAESSFNPSGIIGATIDKRALSIDNELSLFAETQGCYIVSANNSESKKIQSFGKKNNIDVRMIGRVGGDSISVKDSFSVKVRGLYNQWRKSFPN